MNNSLKYSIIFTVVAVVLFSVLQKPLQKGEIHEDIGYDIDELLNKYGYPFENHTVITADGYILELHRIPHGKQNSNNKQRPPVLISHGFGTHSLSWILSGSEYSYAHFMADNGYDVWLMNARGTKYSRKHVTLDPERNAQEFFNYTVTEIALNDLSAVIDYTLQVTGSEKIYYTGHSQGTSIMFILLSEKPDYNRKIHAAAMFAPIMYGEHSDVMVFTMFAKYEFILEWPRKYLGVQQFIAPFLVLLVRLFCVSQDIPYYIFQHIVGSELVNTDLALLPLIMASAPTHSGIRNTQHLTQIVTRDTFARMDYGPLENMNRYKSEYPPKYDVSKISVPIALYVGEKDKFTHPKDVEKLKGSIASIVEHNIITDNFQHSDFALSYKARNLLHPRVIRFFEKYK